MNSKRGAQITEGPLFKSIISYAIPIMLGNYISILFNAADIAVLGNYADKNAVAAVGATSAIVALLVSSFIGISAGTNVLLSRFIGAKDEENAKRCVDTSIIGSFALGIFIALVCFAVSKTFLVWSACPTEIIDDANVYLRYYFLGIPAMMVYNFGATIIRASGDSRKPFLYLALSGLLNLVLNLILCVLLTQKVVAVAIATLVSQTLGAVLVIIHLLRLGGMCRFSFKNMTFSVPILKGILKNGLPCAFNTSLYAISNLQIQAAINSFGPACVAGNAIAGNIEGFVSAINSAFGTTTIVFVSQNYGARNQSRLDKAIWINGIISFSATLILGNLIYIFGESIFSIYLPGEQESISFAMTRASYILLCYWIPGIKAVINATTQGYGYAIYPMATSIIAILGVRVLWMAFIYPLFPQYVSIVQCYIVTWALSSICDVIIFAIIHKKKKNELKIPPSFARA